jgi:hypothetical protein
MVWYDTCAWLALITTCMIIKEKAHFPAPKCHEYPLDPLSRRGVGWDVSVFLFCMLCSIGFLLVLFSSLPVQFFCFCRFLCILRPSWRYFGWEHQDRCGACYGEACLMWPRLRELSRTTLWDSNRRKSALRSSFVLRVECDLLLDVRWLNNQIFCSVVICHWGVRRTFSNNLLPAIWAFTSNILLDILLFCEW